MFQLLNKVGLNGFFLLLMLAIILAYFFPHLGTADSMLHLPVIAEYGVVLIFFFYGLKLNRDKLKAGLGNWKLHLVIQSSTFILFPLLVMCTGMLLQSDTASPLWVGAFYLAALPSTVSSSVVMVGIAGGNLPAAIFNASISSIIGIFITPLWMSSILETSNNNFDVTGIMLKLCLQVLLPVTLGFLLNKKFGARAEKHKDALRNFVQFIILLIVFTSFSESFAGNMFAGHTIWEIILLGIIMQVLFFLVFGIMYLVANLIGLNREDRITVLFCGSKKSLVQGAVMGKVLFPDPVILGVILLPLMLYHALQLLSGSIIAGKMGEHNKKQ
jgi:sodium/bile acid cotransporter 7